MRRLMVLSLAAMLGSLGPAAHAQDYNWASGEYDYASRQLDDFTDRFNDDLVDPVLRSVRKSQPTTPPLARTAKSPSRPASEPVAGPLLFTPVRVPREQSVAYRIAATYPPEGRAKAEALFNQLLQGYAEVERLNGVPKGDLGAAVAMFMGGNWMAMNNRDLADQAFVPIIAQMRGALAASPGFAQLSNAQKQEIYQQMVIHGMLMATTQMALKTKNDPATVTRMKAAAKANLTQWLGTDATRLQVTARGMELAE